MYALPTPAECRQRRWFRHIFVYNDGGIDDVCGFKMRYECRDALPGERYYGICKVVPCRKVELGGLMRVARYGFASCFRRCPLDLEAIDHSRQVSLWNDMLGFPEGC